MKVKVLSKKDFGNYLKAHNITLDNTIELSDTAFISINHFTSTANDIPYTKDNLLMLFFNDVDAYEFGAFTEDDAIQVIDFIEENKDKRFVIHCGAGISRSGAIGTFITSYLGFPMDEFKKNNPNVIPNPHVVITLNRQLWQKHFATKI